MSQDPFEDLLSLEEQFYNEGYQLGLNDGRQTGCAEGRAFGLEKGFDKYKTLGKIHGRSSIWLARLQSQQSTGSGKDGIENGSNPDEWSPSFEDAQPLPALPAKPRLEKHLHSLMSLTDPLKIPTVNTDESVEDCDERIIKAEAKVQVVEKMIGERSQVADVQQELGSPNRGKQLSANQPGKKQGEGDIEDMTAMRMKD